MREYTGTILNNEKTPTVDTEILHKPRYHVAGECWY